MAIDKAVDSTQLNADLTSVANAIRTKGKTSAQLAFPEGFVSAVNAISEPPTGTKQISITQNGTSTTDVSGYANAEVTANVPQMKRMILRPDAEIAESWTYDKLWIADEGETLPAYTTTQQILRQYEELNITHEWDLDNYKYSVLSRSLVIPYYNTDEIARGRVEWSSSTTAYELTCFDGEDFPALVDPTITAGGRPTAWVATGVQFPRLAYFVSSSYVSIYSSTSYGIWCSLTTPSYSGNVPKIMSPQFTLRCQPNIFDQRFYEAITDIRFQYIIELWREPIGSLSYDGWTVTQAQDAIFDAIKSQDHKLR